MFGNRTFEERKDALEKGRCTCFPDNMEFKQCLKNCEYRKRVVEKIEEDMKAGEAVSDEEKETQNDQL